MAQDTMLVRIKKYNPRRGYVLRRYVYADRKTGIRYRFYEDRGWYVVPARIAKILADIHSRVEDPESPFAFDVVTRAEAQRIDVAETVEEEPRATATRARSATDARSAAVPPPGPRDRDDGRGKGRDGAEETSPSDPEPEEPEEPAADPDPLEEPDPEPTATRRSRRGRSSS